MRGKYLPQLVMLPLFLLTTTAQGQENSYAQEQGTTGRIAEHPSFQGEDPAIPPLAATTQLPEVTVTERRPTSAATEYKIREKDFLLRPHSTTWEILNNLPGLFAGQHAGGGKAMQYFLRGFDNDHGTDIAIFVDGIPVNMVSHAHGQGYADLNFLIPEVVDSVDFYKGPYFTLWGDFANSGVVNLITKGDTVENSLQALGGFFDTMRYTSILSPRLGSLQALVANEVYFSDGPFDHPDNFLKYNFFGKLTLDLHPDSRLILWTSVYTGDWDASGQIPLRAVRAGLLDRFGSIDPSEGGKSDRENINLIYITTPRLQENWYGQLYFSRYRLRLFSNFTFFRRDPVRGDGIEQLDSRMLFGGRLRYSRVWALGSLPVQSTLGVETRNDDADVGLFHQERRQRFATTTKTNIWQNSFSGYMQHEFFLRDWVRLITGLRGDVFLFDVDDRLPAHSTGGLRYQGNTIDGIVSPKVTLVVSPFLNTASLWRSTDFFLNFGMGFHSNDARDAIQRDGTALARSTGGEVGARTNLWQRLDLAAALWLLDLSSELVFVGDEGTTEASGPTRRWGVDFETRYQVFPWLFADFDLTYADPRFRVTGEAIPLAPTLLLQGGVTAYLTDGFSAALRLRYLDDRPAIEDRSLTARGHTLVDFILNYRWRNLEASLQLLNLANHDWRETQFATTSCLRREVGADPRCPIDGGEDGIPDIHFVPGYPINLRGGLTIFF